VIIFGILAAFMVKSREESTVIIAQSEIASGTESESESMKVSKKEDNNQTRVKTEIRSQTESYAEIIVRSLKIYLFVMALTFLGAGFEPFIEKYLLGLSPLVLYWLNMISAVLDNATL